MINLLNLKEGYSFCESVTGIRRVWCIRKLTKVGRKLGGGIDTKPLCELFDRGWDLEVTKVIPSAICPKCLERYENE